MNTLSQDSRAWLEADGAGGFAFRHRQRDSDLAHTTACCSSPRNLRRAVWCTLAPGSPGYAPRYEGGVRARDFAYHQGTVWPWLIGALVQAWLRVRDHSEAAKKEAAERFIMPLLAHRDQAGLGHISEIADGDPPHEPAGCPFQAWSLGELLRLDPLL